jgi:hypothetical protein
MREIFPEKNDPGVASPSLPILVTVALLDGGPTAFVISVGAEAPEIAPRSFDVPSATYSYVPTTVYVTPATKPVPIVIVEVVPPVFDTAKTTVAALR